MPVLTAMYPVVLGGEIYHGLTQKTDIHRIPALLTEKQDFRLEVLPAIICD